MLNAVADGRLQRETWLFYGVRNGGEHIMRDHLRSVEREHPDVHVAVCYSDPSAQDVLLALPRGNRLTQGTVPPALGKRTCLMRPPGRMRGSTW